MFKSREYRRDIKKTPREDENLHFNAMLPSHFLPSQVLITVAGEQQHPCESNMSQRDIMDYIDASMVFNEQLGY